MHTDVSSVLILILHIFQTNCLQKIEEQQILNHEEFPHNPVCEYLNINSLCDCSKDDLDTMTLDCSNITNEAELRQVMHRGFLPSTFRTFSIDGFYNYTMLSTLSPGIFGKSIFEEVQFRYVPNLVIKSMDIFTKMADTLVNIVFSHCDLTNFVSDLSQFVKLDSVELDGNFMSVFALVSPTATSLNLGFNKLRNRNFLASMPNLHRLWLYNNKFRRVPDVSQYRSLIWFGIKSNQITELRENELCHSEFLYYVDLSSNAITVVEKNSICVENGGKIRLGNNNISILEREVFEPIVKNVSSQGLDLFDNPLQCGCDIAWLFNISYLQKIGKYTTCLSGEYLVQLEPSRFEKCGSSLFTSQKTYHDTPQY